MHKLFEFDQLLVFKSIFLPKEAANGSSFGYIEDKLEVLKGSFIVEGVEILKGSFPVKGLEVLKGSIYKEELEFLNGFESIPPPLFKKAKTS